MVSFKNSHTVKAPVPAMMCKRVNSNSIPQGHCDASQNTLFIPCCGANLYFRFYDVTYSCVCY